MAGPVLKQPPRQAKRVVPGAERLTASGFSALAGRRVGLVTNHTGLAAGRHLADLMHEAGGVKLAAILAPEHGFRGSAEAGEKVGDAVDARTGVPVFSLYGRTRKPTPRMLKGLDALVFDIQDIGARFYTYISTMGLAMQAAAEAGIPFVALDRPNPLGGAYVSGFVIEPGLMSFVGQYPIPIVHGMTVGELARMIKGEGWLEGVSRLDLEVVEVRRLQRAMRWPETGHNWVATSPNIPTFDAALVYPGIGLVGDTLMNEGRGTPTPFTLFGAPWLDAGRLAGQLRDAGLPGLAFRATQYTPRSIPRVATNPRHEDERVNGVRISITDHTRVEPMELGVTVLSLVAEQARAKGARLFGKLGMFNALAGTRRLHGMLTKGARAETIIAAWADEVARFKTRRQQYLLY